MLSKSCNKSSWFSATTTSSSLITDRNRRVELDIEDEAKLLLMPPHYDCYCLDLDLDLMDALLSFLNLDELAADCADFGEGAPRIEFLLELLRF